MNRSVSPVSMTTEVPTCRSGPIRSTPLPTSAPRWTSSTTQSGPKMQACATTAAAVGPLVVSTSQPRAAERELESQRDEWVIVDEEDAAADRHAGRLGET